MYLYDPGSDLYHHLSPATPHPIPPSLPSSPPAGEGLEHLINLGANVFKINKNIECFTEEEGGGGRRRRRGGGRGRGGERGRGGGGAC